MAQYHLRGKKATSSGKPSKATTPPPKMAAHKKAPLSLEVVMSANRESKDDLSTQIDTKTAGIQTTLTKIESSLSSLADKVAEMERRVSANEDNLGDALKRLDKTERELRYVKDKLDDLEDKSRSNNIRIFNIPEKSEGRDAAVFLKEIIPQILNTVTFDTPIVIERCHCFSKASDKTRPLIAKFLNFKNKEKVLRWAREMKEIFFENRRIYIYADCSAETQR